MAFEFIDVSEWQGDINWPAVDRPAAIIRASYLYQGQLYNDTKATQNYYQAKAAGKAVGLYHFAGGGDPTGEADFFIKACSPLDENDVLVLDWEQAIATHPNAAQWCQAFIQRVYDQTKVWPFIYMNLSTLAAYDWSWVLERCGLWIAAPSYSPDDDVPTGGHQYVMHQYGSPSGVSGVSGACDVDRFYGTLDQFKAYGYHSQPAPPPAPVVTTNTVIETKVIPFAHTTFQDATLPEGDTVITQHGADGVETITYLVTYTDGVETARVIASDETTVQPIDEATHVGTKSPIPDPTPTPEPTPTPTPGPTPKPLTLLDKLIDTLLKLLANLFGGKK